MESTNDNTAVMENIAAMEMDEPYSTFSRFETLFVVYLCTLATLLSPLAANVYYPVILELSNEFGVSTNLINLSITVYLIFQGLAPTFTGSISDAIGRRPAYLVCFVIYFGANIGLALQGSYAGLLVLRCLQSAGSSGTVALAQAMVSDIVLSSERGSYISYSSVGTFLGQAIGPLIGGLLSTAFGWRSIFWFLVIFSAVVFLIFVAILPETCRAVVGNGSIPPQKWNISLLTYLTDRRFLRASSTPIMSSSQVKSKPIDLLATFKIVFSRQGACILLYTGFLFGGFYSQIATVPVNFKTKFGFSPWQIGLCYIPFGFGCMLAFLTTGHAVDWNFRRIAKLLEVYIVPSQHSDLSNFPIEKARIQIVIPLVILGSIITALYGWVFQLTNLLAALLVLLFFMGFSLCGAYSAFSTLLVDLYPCSAGSAAAAGNLARCWMGAAAVAGTV